MTTEQSPKPVILITGSSGLLGQALAKAFVKDYCVVGLDVKEPDEPLEGYHPIACDLTDDEHVRKALDSVGQTYGTHSASAADDIQTKKIWKGCRR
jgi:NAD(P)-dependent dehydrogenase (short-subunit alcohol dehydrogenase family)